MTAGLPVVVPTQVNVYQEVKDARAGIVTGLAPSEIAAAIEQLLAHNWMRREMGRNGAVLAREHFGLEKVSKETVGMYENVVREFRTRR